VSREGTVRTCIGCRDEKDKRELVRLVESPGGVIVIDYKGNLPGRGSYICPKESCVRDAFKKGGISRAFKGAGVVDVEGFLNELRERVLERFSSLLSISRKAGRVLDGREAVEKGIDKGSARLVLMAEDISMRSFSDIAEKCLKKGIVYRTYLSKDRIGALIGKGERGAVGVTDESLSSMLEREMLRLRSLGIQGV
jgi:predicted RNA-binding protein YlxR (DUF448 family)/ribosomal protein L30E